MSDETVKAALTAEQWADVRAERIVTFRNGEGAEVAWVDGRLRYGSYPSRHALAALALHGQPFGFTSADLAIIDEALVDCDLVAGDRNVSPADHQDSQRQRTALVSLRSRVAALLPPESAP